MLSCCSHTSTSPSGSSFDSTLACGDWVSSKPTPGPLLPLGNRLQESLCHHQDSTVGADAGTSVLAAGCVPEVGE